VSTTNKSGTDREMVDIMNEVMDDGCIDALIIIFDF
jgi:hypothetical protein